jgi:hypothetical protein
MSIWFPEMFIRWIVGSFASGRGRRLRSGCIPSSCIIWALSRVKSYRPSASYYLLAYCVSAGFCVELMQMLVGQLGAPPSLLVPNRIVVQGVRCIAQNIPIQGGTCFLLGCRLRVYWWAYRAPIRGPCNVAGIGNPAVYRARWSSGKSIGSVMSASNEKPWPSSSPIQLFYMDW